VGELHAAAEALRDRLETSPLIGWLKDLDGRYVYVNRGYVEQLDATAERVLGHADAELAPREGIDGPRLQNGGNLEDEPLQLEYRVGAFEGRPALTVLRFPVRDPDGTPIFVCGVAAPLEHAHRAREECSELMGIGAGDSSGPGAAELAQERRRVAALHEASASAARRAHELAVELADVREQRGRLEHQLAEERERRDHLQEELAAARAVATGSDDVKARVAALEAAAERAYARADELEAAAHREQSRAGALEGELESVRSALSEVTEEESRQRARAEQAEAALRGAREREMTAVGEQRARAEAAQDRAETAEARAEAANARAEAAEARAEAADAHAAETQSLADALQAELAETAARCELLEAERASLTEALADVRAEAVAAPGVADAPLRELDTARRPSWSGHAQRALASAVAQASEWRTGVRDAVKVIGIEGGWDAVSVWVPDERRPHLKCSAMWMAEADGRAEFETRTWQRPHAIAETELGRAFSSGDTAWITRIGESTDDRLVTAAAEGMGTALIVPICEGGRSVAVLELLCREVAPPDEDVAASIAAVAVQLGHFWHLLRAGAAPHWRLGRF
jgi:hypothetical protein